MAVSAPYPVCECSDDPHVHVQTLDQLRSFLDAGGRPALPIWCDALRVPDFDDADEADLWLWNHDAVEAIERDRERHLELHGHGGRI